MPLKLVALAWWLGSSARGEPSMGRHRLRATILPFPEDGRSACTASMTFPLQAAVRARRGGGVGAPP